MKSNLYYMKKLRRILLIDDDEVTCYINKTLLEGLELADEIDCVHNGLEGLNYIEQHCSKETIEQETAPSLIFLDVKMPIMDGFEFLEALEDLDDVDRSRLHIVMLTTSENIKDTQRASTFGDKLHSYLNKPLETNAVKQVLLEIPLF